MRNRFNINESEKNRIRTLHGINIIKEQDENQPKVEPDIEDKVVEKELAWGTGENAKTTVEFLKNLITLVKKQIAAIPLVGKTINLYIGTEGDRNRTGEGKVVGNFTLQSVKLGRIPGSNPPKELNGDIVLLLTFRGPKGDLNAEWSCGWKYMRVVTDPNSEYDLGKDVKTYHGDSDMHKVVTNDQFIDSLQKSECPPVADFSVDRYKKAPFTELTWMAGYNYGRGFKIVEPADFAMGDEGDTGETVA